MCKISSENLRTTLAGCIGSLLISSTSLSYADDTEIFFGGPSIDDGVRPNVLFILDNSGSMQWSTSSNSNPPSGEKSRMQILKDSFAQIMSTAGAINAGVMVLNPRDEYGGTRMVYPVTYINDQLPSSVQQVATTPRILVSGDDATQSSLGGGADISSTRLQMGYVSTTTSIFTTQKSVLRRDDAFFQSVFGGANYACAMNENGSNHNTSGDACGNDDRDNINIRSNNDTGSANDNPIRGTAMMHFTGLNVPPAAGLDTSFKAYLDLRPTQNNGTRPTISVTVQDSKSPPPPQSLYKVDDGRTYLPNVNIPSPNNWDTSNNTRLDITDQVKQVLDNDSDSLSSLFLKVRATTASDYIFCMASGSGSVGSQCGTSGGVYKAPTIVIEYNSSSTVSETKSAALRFQEIGIPKGATIESARIDFAPAAGNLPGDTLTLDVKAELVGDASIIEAGSDVMGRTPKTTAISWTVPEWAAEAPPIEVQGPDVTSLVQQVVNTSGWCGNNSMAFFFEPESGNSVRTAFSLEGGIGLQPTLTVNYSGGSTGCLNPIIEATVNSSKDDAYQQANDIVILDGNTIPVTTDRFGARFTAVPLKQGATILDAQVFLTPANTVTSASISTNVRFEQIDSAPPFAGSNNNISGRSEAGASTCTINNWINGTPFICSQAGIKTGLQGVINRSGWTPGNAIAMTFTQSSTSTLLAQAYESNPGQAIKLRMKIASGGIESEGYTVREHLNSLVQSMSASSGTPIVPTYLDAARYLRGETLGLSSPITSACQPTHVVLLTDGQANGNDATTRSDIASLAGSCSAPLVSTNIADTTSTDSDERCGRKLAEWLALTDQSSLDDESVVNTHTIGFALGSLAPSTVAQTFLSNIASNGKGGAYTAENATELTKAFSDILQEVQDVDTTFVSASAPVNSFERQNNKDELYFSLFSPQETHRWPGNLKRYRFALEDKNGAPYTSPIIVDVDGTAAVDPVSGNFVSTAQSYWSSSADGNNSAIGGAASKLPSPISRKLYTYTGSAPTAAVALSAHPLSETNTGITKTLLGDAGMTDDDRLDLISYIRGTEPNDSSVRKTLGDPIHSSPRLATYSCLTPNGDKCDKDDQVAFIGTNEGFLQAFNTDSGEEIFGFMPQELLGNIRKLEENTETSSSKPRPYGMDNPVTLWANDANKDGKIFEEADDASPQAGEFIYAYATMGRGGRGVYALDVTERNNPKLLWQIIGGQTPGFMQLGQTWSAPVKTKIKVGSNIKDVLVFAGGYDEAQDDATELKADTVGNALYIVDANTGELFWSASTEASNTSASGHKTMSKMLYSMPGTVRVIDLQTSPTGTLVTDPDRLADQLFIGDMGGQVWRFYINNGSSGAGLVTAGGASGNGVFATALPDNYSSLDLNGKRENLRRFYNEPDVALLNKDGKFTLSVNIGSGFRGHPLNTYAVDKFYSFRTSNLTDSAGAEGTLKETDLLDITSNLTPDADSEKLILPDGTVKGGWLISLSTNSGEKVLTRALTAGVKNVLFFSTYQPAASNPGSCEAAFGTARGYAVDLFDGSPMYPVDPTNPKFTDRYDTLKLPGIPPQPELICIGDQCFVIKGPGDIEEVETPKNGKMYWIDKTEID